MAHTHELLNHDELQELLPAGYVLGSSMRSIVRIGNTQHEGYWVWAPDGGKAWGNHVRIYNGPGWEHAFRVWTDREDFDAHWAELRMRREEEQLERSLAAQFQRDTDRATGLAKLKAEQAETKRLLEEAEMKRRIEANPRWGMF
jgi:hypothetical protein